MSDVCDTDCSSHAAHNCEATEWVVRTTRGRRQTANQPARRHLLPEGFPFVVDDVTGVVSELVLLYLYEEHYKRRSFIFVPNKLLAYAYDCKDWLAHLDFTGITWHQATVTDLSFYCGVLRATVSPTTGKAYSNLTIRRRKSTIEGLYAWARQAGLAPDVIPNEALLFPIVGTSTHDSEETRETVEIPQTADDCGPIRVMAHEQSVSILNALGPLPSVRDATAPIREDLDVLATRHTSRDRLAAEYALNVGLRVSEVRGLSVNNFAAYRAEDIDPVRNYQLEIIGKGRRQRTTLIPGWLIGETLKYIKGERSEIVSLCKSGTDPSALLLNPASTTRYAGGRVSVRTLERQFESACMRAGQYTDESRTLVEHTEGGIAQRAFLKRVARFVFHDLRHTYAVWTYYARKASGDSEPWLFIQARLGHAHLSTTLNTYLAAADTFEATVSDMFSRYINEKRS